MSKFAISKNSLVHWGLYGLIIFLLAGIAVGGYFLHQQLSRYVLEVDHLKIDSDINEQGIANAQRLRTVLTENEDNVDRAASIVADTKYYQYQDQIVRDITSYASAANLTVLGFDFTTAAPGKTSTSTVKGLKTINATISLQSPVPYTNYLKFLKLIERNLTKMQVTQLDISNNLKTPGGISSPVMMVEVYVR